MGLSCSYTIVKKLGGDITLKKSKRGLTIFSFKIPVKTKQRTLTLLDEKIKRIKSNDINNSGIIDYEFVNVDIKTN